MMQNWEHILVLMEAMNKPPRDIHKLTTDLTRVRLWSLDGYAPLYRQTLIFSSTPVDYHRALIGKCTNFAGKIEVLKCKCVFLFSSVMCKDYELACYIKN